MYKYYERGNALEHHGILGQKWGVRRYQPYPKGHIGGKEIGEAARKPKYSSTSLAAKIAKRSNDKVDKGFKKWNENAKKRENAIELGKKANVSKMAWETSKDKTSKAQYKTDKKNYKKSLRTNTTYRKGQIKKSVQSDLARKYLSEAKKIEKRLISDPSNRELKKQYSQLMSQHDILRAKARRAPEVAANRSRKIASLKRARTCAIKSAVVTSAVGVGTYAVNKRLKNTGHNGITSDKMMKFVEIGKKVSQLGRYI